MTGYTRRWNCQSCGKPQESVDWPKVELCDKCEAVALSNPSEGGGS